MAKNRRVFTGAGQIPCPQRKGGRVQRRQPAIQCPFGRVPSFIVSPATVGVRTSAAEPVGRPPCWCGCCWFSHDEMGILWDSVVLKAANFDNAPSPRRCDSQRQIWKLRKLFAVSRKFVINTRIMLGGTMRIDCGAWAIVVSPWCPWLRLYKFTLSLCDILLGKRCGPEHIPSIEPHHAELAADSADVVPSGSHFFLRQHRVVHIRSAQLQGKSARVIAVWPLWPSRNGNFFRGHGKWHSRSSTQGSWRDPPMVRHVAFCVPCCRFWRLQCHFATRCVALCLIQTHLRCHKPAVWTLSSFFQPKENSTEPEVWTLSSVLQPKVNSI